MSHKMKAKIENMKWDSRVLGSFWDISATEELKRLFHTTNIIDDTVFIFGGLMIDYGEKETVTDSFITYNLANGYMKKLKDHNLPCLSQHTSTYYELSQDEQYLLIFGGKGKEISNELYRFDIKTKESTKIQTKGTSPKV